MVVPTSEDSCERSGNNTTIEGLLELLLSPYEVAQSVHLLIVRAEAGGT